MLVVVVRGDGSHEEDDSARREDGFRADGESAAGDSNVGSDLARRRATDGDRRSRSGASASSP